MDTVPDEQEQNWERKRDSSNLAGKEGIGRALPFELADYN
jgi:hypothetical protein